MTNILNISGANNNELKEIISKYNLSQKAQFFENDIINFFQNDIPNFNYMFRDRILIRGKDFTSPTGFDEDYFNRPKNYPNSFDHKTKHQFEIEQNYSRSYNNLGRILEKKDESLIFKATLMVRQYFTQENFSFEPIPLSEDYLKGIFDDYMSCNYKFYSLACDRVFDVGDGDDIGAVEYHYLKDKDGKNTNQIIFIDIWIRSFLD